MALVDIAISGNVGEIIFNRPEKLNALSLAVLEEFDGALSTMADDPSVSCVLLWGRGRAFSVGFDLAEGDGSEDIYSDWVRLSRKTERWLRVWDFPKPIVASIQGYCIAGAFFLACCTDVIVVAEDLKLGWARVPIGAAWLTAAASYGIGMRKVMELSSVRGSYLSGREAVGLGWANYALPAENVLEKARELAAGMARTPLDLLLLNKWSAHRFLERQGFRDAITAGVELDNIGHFAPSAQRIKQMIREEGLARAIGWFDSGGRADP